MASCFAVAMSVSLPHRGSPVWAREFVALRNAYDAAPVTLELAEVHAALGHTAEVKALACESAPIFVDQRVHREAYALQQVVDPGEAEAIVLFEQRPCRFLFMDDRRGRALAKTCGVPVADTAARGHAMLDAAVERIMGAIAVLDEV